nr:hypothetical protein [Saccharolobus solfataricus]
MIYLGNLYPGGKKKHKSLAEEVENFVEENRGRAEEALWKNEYPMDCT